MRHENQNGTGVHHLLQRHLQLAGGSDGSDQALENLIPLANAVYESRDARFYTIAEHISDGVLLTNASLDVTYANRAVLDILKCTPEAITGQSIKRIVPELDLAALGANADDPTLMAGQDTMARRCDGQRFDAQFSIFSFKVGKTGQRICLLRDVRETKVTRRERDERTAELKAVLDTMPQGVLMFDEAGQVSASNAQAWALLDIKEPASGAKICFEDIARHLFADVSQDKITRLAKRLRARRRGIIELVRGEGRVLEARLGPVGAGGIIISFTDISAHKKALHEAKKANEAKSAFLAMMSHELRTPMNAVLGMAGLLEKSKLDDEQRENVKTLIDAGDVLMCILNDVLDLSKIEAGKLETEEIDVDMRHTLRKLERLWRPTIEAKGLRFTMQIDDQVPAHLIGDPVRIRQILFNLLSNAAKFTEKGHITLRVSARPASDNRMSIRFEVEDTGVGMEKAVLKKLFSTFEQADKTTTRRYGGTGLGLSISRRLATMMGGDITVRSQIGEGSVFCFNLLAKTDQTGAQEETPQNKADNKDIQDSARILAVEDNPINQRVLASFLRPVGGEVTWAGHGQEALDIMQTCLFDVVLMDIQMPVMDGLSATKALRASDSPNAQTPVIAMTANAMLGDRETCIAAGMNDYISKPIDPRALYGAIARAMGQARRGGVERKTNASAG